MTQLAGHYCCSLVNDSMVHRACALTSATHVIDVGHRCCCTEVLCNIMGEEGIYENGVTHPQVLGPAPNIS
jgi:hypothetical protein